MVTDTVDILKPESLEERQLAFGLWVENVRNPATANTEGLRKLTVLHGAARAEYEISSLPNGRWAVTVHCSYHCGNCHGVGIPWMDFSKRAECISFFLTTARHHFTSKLDLGVSDLQKQAQAEMRRELSDGLFGFTEPISSLGYESQDQQRPIMNEGHHDGEDEATTSL